ncbi:MAG: LysR family transcriptional regulator [Pseudomonadota bacterium]
MSDRRLEVFYTVAKLLSFTKAADELSMTQPAVTFQVRQLEESFGTRLFDRAHNKVSLTRAGIEVFAYSERILGLYTEMNESIKDMTGDNSGTVMIGASTTIAEYMLPALLGEFKSIYPNVVARLKVANTDGIVSMVEDNTIDLGIVEGAVGNKQLLVEPCREDQLVVIAEVDHPLSQQDTVQSRQLLEYPYIIREAESGTRGVLSEYLESQGFQENELDYALEMGSTEAIKGAVEAGMGISVVSEAAIQKELQLGILRVLPLEPPLQRDFSFVRQRQKFRTRLMERLYEFAQEYCERQSGQA